ncbi:hypothetical protein [Chryseobacterium gallinarum]|uniref:hypothetical protein n=1 Tax=Chryseobacterium gallinarum TaxID=1324352 RepID=UPI000AFB9E08|nr:hypothetical protein [Chryseobacterium gallinarum]
MKKYILSAVVSIVVMFAQYGKTGYWSFNQLIMGFLIVFFVLHHLEIANNKKY